MFDHLLGTLTKPNKPGQKNMDYKETFTLVHKYCTSGLSVQITLTQDC